MWHKIAVKEEVTEGSVKCVNVADKKVLLTRSGNTYYACGAICPHQGISMENGLVFDEEITCPNIRGYSPLRPANLPGRARDPAYRRIPYGSLEKISK